MVRDDILGAVISAISRGESLNQIRLSLSNAGYHQEDIEDAIQNLNQPQIQPLQPPKILMPQQTIPKVEQKSQVVQKVSNYGQEQERLKKLIPAIKQQMPFQQTPQKVSSYIPSSGAKQKTALFLLSICLGILLISLIGILLFKTEVIDFFNILLA